MKNPLQALLPIHALRERRALRQYHEQKEAHALAVQAHDDARDEQHRLEREAHDTVARIATAEALDAAEIHWSLHAAAGLEASAQVCEESLPALGEQVQRSHTVMDDAHAAHLARVRAHRKVDEASRLLTRRQARTEAAQAEQLAEDDYAVKWARSQGQAESA